MKLTLFSVSYAGTVGDKHSLTLSEFIHKAADMGFESVMLMGKRPHLSILDYDENKIDSLLNTMKERNISCSVLAGYVDLTSAHAAEVPCMEFQISYVQKLSEIAARLGAKVIRVFTAYESTEQNLNQDWKRVVLTLQENVAIEPKTMTLRLQCRITMILQFTPMV